MRQSDALLHGTLSICSAAMLCSAPALAQTAVFMEEVQRQALSVEVDEAINYPSDSDAEGASAAIVPFPLSDPEFGSGGGIVAAVTYDPAGEPSPWMTALSGAYTFDDSWTVGLTHRMSLGGDRVRMFLALGYGEAESAYHGIGGEAGETGDPVTVDERDFSSIGDIRFQPFVSGLLSHVHFGARLRYLNVDAVVRDGATTDIPSAALNSDLVAGGPVFTFDTTDNAAAATKGVDVNGSWMFGLEGLGSDYGHRKLELLANAYFKLDEGAVLVVRKTACAIKGDAPFYDLCLFGQRGDLRGYDIGRYRDKASWVLQLELRQNLGNQLDGVAFIGVGGIAPSSGDIWKRSHVLSSAGFGLRYRPKVQNRVRFRADIAFAQHGPGFYLGIGDAF